MSDINAARCRNLWGTALLSFISDYNKDHCKHLRMKDGNPESVLDEARYYFTRRDGREVAANAWLDINMRRILELIALPRGEFKLRLSAFEEMAA